MLQIVPQNISIPLFSHAVAFFQKSDWLNFSAMQIPGLCQKTFVIISGFFLIFCFLPQIILSTKLIIMLAVTTKAYKTTARLVKINQSMKEKIVYWNV